MIQGMSLPAHLDRLNADELRGLLIESQARIDKLTYELAYYKRQRYGVKAEHYEWPRLVGQDFGFCK